MQWLERNLSTVAAAVALAAGTLAPSLVFAWGADGHRLVAAQAQQLLTPAARAEVDRLLALEPGATLASISTWADETRSPGTAAWHYVNLPRDADCVYEAARDCPGDACVVGAITRQEAVLTSTASDADKLVALKYLVHFVGDVHQPLHAGYADDKGGNTYQVRFDGRGTNLHAVWDSGLIRTWPGGADALRAGVSAGAAKVTDTSTPAQWAQESCRIVAAPGFYPRGHVLGDEYAAQMDPVIVDRLAAAVSRLSAVLNTALGPR